MERKKISKRNRKLKENEIEGPNFMIQKKNCMNGLMNKEVSISLQAIIKL